MELDKIYQGDAYELIKQIPDKSIDLVIIDPPYEFVSGGTGKCEMSKRALKMKKECYSPDTENTKKSMSNGYMCGGGCFGTKKRNYHSEINNTDTNKARQVYLDYIANNGKDKESERLKTMANALDNKSDTKFISAGFSNDMLDELCRVMKKINIYVWCSKRQLRQIIDYFDDKGCFLDLLTWHKTNPIPTCNNTYLSDTEYCVFAREKGVKVRGTMETKRKYYVSECNVKDKQLYDHPTVKPLDIIENLVINSSERGG